MKDSQELTSRYKMHLRARGIYNVERKQTEQLKLNYLKETVSAKPLSVNTPMPATNYYQVSSVEKLVIVLL